VYLVALRSCLVEFSLPVFDFGFVGLKLLDELVLLLLGAFQVKEGRG
jgi:hypothetical protein